jgi:hypothetical protein
MRWLVIAALLAVLAVLAGCKDKAAPKSEPNPHPHPAPTKSYVVDISACGNALDKAVSQPLDARPQLLLEGCQVCGREWTPLLQWNVEPAQGGPRREQIETLMVECQAFCTGDSKLKFMAAVDKVRGKNVDSPWRQLETACKQAVNGAPDARYMSAPFFALDRIARAVAAKPELASKLSGLELPLPALTVNGVGVVLPTVDGATSDVASLHVTVLGTETYVGRLPRGKLIATGVAVDADYPGDAVKPDALAAKLTELAGGDKTKAKTKAIVILAPHAMPAQQLVSIIAAASTVAPVYLAAAAPQSPPGWQLPAAIPIALGAGKDIQVTSEMTVQNLARELDVRAARKETRVGVTKQ